MIQWYSMTNFIVCNICKYAQRTIHNDTNCPITASMHTDIYIHTHMIGINQQPFNLRVVYDLFANRHNLTLSSCDFQWYCTLDSN